LPAVDGLELGRGSRAPLQRHVVVARFGVKAQLRPHAHGRIAGHGLAELEDVAPVVAIAAGDIVLAGRQRGITTPGPVAGSGIVERSDVPVIVGRRHVLRRPPVCQLAVASGQRGGSLEIAPVGEGPARAHQRDRVDDGLDGRAAVLDRRPIRRDPVGGSRRRPRGGHAHGGDHEHGQLERGLHGGLDSLTEGTRAPGVRPCQAWQGPRRNGLDRAIPPPGGEPGSGLA
jgi:hypothetical protein